MKTPDLPPPPADAGVGVGRGLFFLTRGCKTFALTFSAWVFLTRRSHGDSLQDHMNQCNYSCSCSVPIQIRLANHVPSFAGQLLMRFVRLDEFKCDQLMHASSCAMVC